MTQGHQSWADGTKVRTDAALAIPSRITLHISCVWTRIDMCTDPHTVRKPVGRLKGHLRILKGGKKRQQWTTSSPETSREWMTRCQCDASPWGGVVSTQVLLFVVEESECRERVSSCLGVDMGVLQYPEWDPPCRPRSRGRSAVSLYLHSTRLLGR